MKLLVLFFSGTGNTQYISEYLKDHLLKELQTTDLEITLAAIEWVDPKIVNDYNIICLGYPVYAGLAPSLVREFIDTLPQVKKKGLFVFNTKGIAEGVANWHTIRQLEKKGFKSLGFYSFVMPASDEISMLIKKNSKIHKKMLSKNFDQIRKVDKFVSKMTKTIQLLNTNQTIDELPRKVPIRIFGFITTSILLGLFSLIGNVMSKKLHADDNCTACEICVEECPVQNISLIDNDIVFDDRCIFCLRCVNNCPEEAIQIGNITIGKARWRGPKSNFKSLKYKTPITFKQ
ncbi:MAG: EFR1 family ferrodoxin [Candidatus Heimdallarchaeota archaeon]